MTLWTLVCLVNSAWCGDVDSLDSFQYATREQAQDIWHARSDGGVPLPVETVPEQGRSVLAVAAPFAAQPQCQRVYIDREVRFDLSAAGEFQLEIATDDPQAAGRVSLYFRSGDGWYAASQSWDSPGWQVMKFSKASFAVEGRPRGWHSIDTVRIAIWRGQPADVVVRLRQLSAVQHAVALVLPARAVDAERATALQTAEDVGDMLASLGLGSDAIEDDAVIDGALGTRRVAILAYNPVISSRAVEALMRFVEQGGKLIVCYQSPPRLASTLGFGELKYVRPDSAGRFAEIRFDASDVPHLPASVRQSSWNITAAVPSGHNARVIAHWYDQQGTRTDYPALLVSDRGAFFTHILLRDDRAGKLQMLAGLLGYLAPDLWRPMADHALDESVRVGHCRDYASLRDFVQASAQSSARAALAEAQQLLSEASHARQAEDFPAAVRMAGEIHDRLVRAYCLAQPSRAVEGRACWNHSGTGAYPGDWDRTARELAAAGFNMVVPNMLWGGVAHYPSDILPRSRTYDQHGDQIEQCLTAARAHGLQVHVWKVNWNLSGAPPEFVAQIHREARNQVTAAGQPVDWLCPSHPENFQLELDSMLEVARKYEVDGLHFDYIRYPDGDHCFCDGCRQRFEVAAGQRVQNWPAECHSGSLRESYTQWRCDQITRLVRAVHEQAKAIRSDLAISAAVFSEYPNCRATVAQDWPRWVEAGYLDFISPMNYTPSDQAFRGLTANQLRLVNDRIPVYPGIGQWRLEDHRTVGQITLARELGAAGFTMFDLTPDSIRTAVPAIGMGVGRVPASPPHQP